MSQRSERISDEFQKALSEAIRTLKDPRVHEANVRTGASRPDFPRDTRSCPACAVPDTAHRRCPSCHRPDGDASKSKRDLPA